ncbi:MULTISPECIES: tripartite tricarboxylate transporter TctB family protein [Corynebacterium]|uniref:tripartite tricarboxylate transporter TctB family protein n=1 Tax=Corynebacterium TaxID=1716 RepID=UPI001EF1FFE7|nr:tripartite tricarboxylate transporter TctB family protein [Corynebacterium kefirresidentii]MCG7241765.1 tripartite tricarboxylate transporter TctB family protein [Corynebacterium kefirresidentii]MCG7284070.1 tripartite tricarboxylate transporter TctB family protein [Corynebacterium kefirresidentii]
MADQNKLTVAELLARNNKARGEKESKKDNRSRRHRRSLDEGGISVAELTGNLKKVKASPAEAKHTSVSIDEDAPVIRSPKSAEQAGAEKAVAGKAGADSTKKPAADPAAKPAAKRAAQPAAKAAQTTKPAARPTTKTAAASSATPAAAAPAAQKPAATGAAQDAAKKNQPSADDTAVIQRVDKAGEAKPAAAKPAADTPAAKKPAAEKARAEKPKDDKRAKAAGAGAAAAGAGAAGAGAAAAAVPASKKAGVAKSAEETGNLPKVEDNEDWVEEEHEKLNPVSILLMIVAGILLAIVIFKGFEILWDNFPRLVVAVLALCVTAIMVGVTHALRTARDGFSMFLAGFTGLVLTFGPLLLVML